jgi:citrate lyase subunit beta/citryl-CoA lyase
VQHETTRAVRRSLLFVPASEPRKLDRAAAARADALILDLEDSVAPASKEQARRLVEERLRSASFGASEAIVRVNAPGTAYFDEDLDAAVSAGAAGILVPKAERSRELAEVSEHIAALERRAGRSPGAVRVLALVETAEGVSSARAVAGAARVEALCFGSADFARDMGLPHDDGAIGVTLHARCALAIAARAAGIGAIDTVYLDVRDDEGFRRDALLGLSLGYEGKLCVHPTQVAIANEIHSPTPAQIEHAQRVVDAAREAEREGRGVFTLDGRMIDAPLVASQARVLERARSSRDGR